ncbi:hypothetical protein FOXG_00410 [Fusarium oxysporum f. sp. lycopersici 4287]|uniref:Uncharacterized protein n=2 Tax=Fusarium oxysporum TaxID=5507 RepID=A0A0J9WG27_FUSO4|nr:hypothetical protein FOXG_00410 [Fusarium oxysporum f. sp. lycopersici 4287]KNA94301.1 hypothetical protein FOXG_00410 [Fusarium oxysporum f. sp. lycopersici 4287]
MSHFQSLAAPWPRSARREDLPRTPEPALNGETQPPSPPRPRFRVKRRNASNLNAPTEQFLASVAAADIPIPSIEEPRVLDEEMAETLYPMSHFNNMDDIPFTPHGGSERMFSPPKTPAPDLLPTLTTKQYPNWSIDSTLSSLESSPDYESSRPSTAHSTHTSASLLSYFSISSEDLSQCISPDNEHADLANELSNADDNSKTLKPAKTEVPRDTIRRAPWTKPMNQHLWSTYMMYLQDPKVTPFRIGKSGIPPHGVCLRGPRRALMSPVRLTRSRSTHKRRSNHLEARKIKRPSLGSDLWVDPASIVDLSATNDQFATPQTEPEIDSDVVVPRKNLQQLFEASQPLAAQQQTLAPPVGDVPPRLGSPFALGGSSFSFPNRLSHGAANDPDALRRPFATFQQSSEGNHGVTRSSLASRLAYIDERLKDFRRRDQPRRRSESPL